ncbi:DoxX family membrane protein [Marinigracilibium pacificum]|uniref:DoxX family membrane protein n=1 Tax=Marinigracilibium pacificum TaxID=2729599 RepID=A0A848IU55_9BACT|nr:DoxX family membrane protein [Marinigracilibium pacificum]NMM46835.1 DoxX family membrane protein [Marinigracilibium pacificum]
MITQISFLQEPWTVELIIKICLSIFLAILFLQSGLDKVFNYKDNADWLKSHFANSPISGLTGLMIPLITLLETVAGLISAVGVIMLIISQSETFAFIGALLSTLSIISLFFGQRMAKDYEGASTLTGYFLICVFTLFLYI